MKQESKQDVFLKMQMTASAQRPGWIEKLWLFYQVSGKVRCSRARLEVACICDNVWTPLKIGCVFLIQYGGMLRAGQPRQYADEASICTLGHTIEVQRGR